MPKVTRAQLKNIFVTGAIPTELQYDDVWDSFVHEDDIQAEVFDAAAVSAGFVNLAEPLPDPGTMSEAQRWKAVQVYEGRGVLFPLDYGVPMGYRINTVLNNIELIDRDGHPSKLRVPPAGTRITVVINRKFV